jgi:hypothetical protein
MDPLVLDGANQPNFYSESPFHDYGEPANWRGRE